ncbi:anaphase-promoting complex subunit [Histoplasma capsulatum]|uniref:Anaphase-promoting complex subunit n=1 Tax=Ajellomyces capsulatus TaxID=5037 RepID=A0A8A1M9T6_AJECA|nr:anaphase-promoting complex subunit [Histoplasma capsulatum]
MFQNNPLSISRKRVFDSVFLSAPLSSISPTPISSPVQSLTRAGGTFSSDRNQREPENVPEQVTWDRAWHAATTFLSIPDEGFRNNDDDDGIRDEDTLLKRWAKGPPSQLVSESLFYVGADSSPGKALRQGSKENDVKEWYLSEMRRHFLTNFRTFLVAGLKTRNQPDTLSKLVRPRRPGTKSRADTTELPYYRHVCPPFCRYFIPAF